MLHRKYYKRDAIALNPKEETKMSDEKLKILKMLEEGKLTAEQAATLLSAITEEKAPVVENLKNTVNKDELEAKWLAENMNDNPFPGQKMLLIRVLSAEGDRVKVNLPLGFVKGIISATGKMPYINAEMEGVDVNALMETVVAAIDQDLTGRFVDVETGTGDRVLIEIV